MKDIKRRNLIVIRRIIVSIAVRLVKSNILNLYDYFVIPTNQSAKLYNTLPPAAASGCVLVFWLEILKSDGKTTYTGTYEC